MRRTIFLTSLTTALLAVPLLVGCGNNSTGTIVTVPAGGITLPDCLDGQLIAVDATRTMSCTQALTAGLAPPDCSVVANSALNAYDGILECMPKGAGGTNAGLKTIINKAASDTATIENTINSIKGGGATAKYCGQYNLGGTNNPNGAITGGNGITGIAGAANLCAGVQGCGAGAHMCTVYELYESVAAGTVTAAMNISQSWVHMSSWQWNGGNAANTGLNDNCGDWTYPTGDRAWYGTTVEWKAAITGPKALHFAGASSTAGISCASRFPIACCL